MNYIKPIIDALEVSIFSPLKDLVLEYAQLEIDKIFENTVLREIPIINTLAAFYEVGVNIRERNLAKQTVAFLQGFNDKSISQEFLEKHRKELDSDPGKLDQELSRVIILLDDHIEDVQSEILGAFYRSYIQGAISWDKFCELSVANRKMFFCDYTILCEAARNDGLQTNACKLYQVDRLISLGLLRNNNRLGGNVFIMPQASSKKDSKDILLTSFGQTFYQHFPQHLKESPSIHILSKEKK